ncbi:MAG: hypothetical protein KGZ88_19350 [Methylomicrobium sp.]|nr:hypothetical protein [Methylomicrobium sp.]
MKRQTGFSLVMAVFILVVLGLLAAYMARMSSVQHATVLHALQSARAYQAARAGLGWSVARLLMNGDCKSVTAQSPLSFDEMPGFTVSIRCSSRSFIEGDTEPVVYQLNALSEYGDYQSPDYAARELAVSIVTGE